VALAAVLGGGEVALWVVLALGIGVAAGIYLRSEPKVQEKAVWDRRAPDARHRILVIANETVAGTALRDEVVRRASGRDAEVLVVTPALNSRIRHWTSDEDAAREAAEARLQESVRALAAAGVETRGQVGDDDPLQAIEDALRRFDADEIVVVTHPEDEATWLEQRTAGEPLAEVQGVPVRRAFVSRGGD
jgi:nucleotide-binding universal stress UspA family protein